MMQRSRLLRRRVMWCRVLRILIDAYEQGRPTLGHVEVAHHVTEACIAVAESHRRGSSWVNLPLRDRDLYIFHV